MDKKKKTVIIAGVIVALLLVIIGVLVFMLVQKDAKEPEESVGYVLDEGNYQQIH